MKKYKSQKTISWPAKNWKQLDNELRQYLVDTHIQASGRWQVAHVRVDVPFKLAEQPAAHYASLLQWLKKQNLSFQIFGSTLKEVRVEIFSLPQPPNGFF